MFSYASIMLENHFLIFSIVCSFHLVNIYSFIKVNVYSIDITDGIRLRYYMNAEKGRVSIIIHGLCHLLSPCQAAGQQLEPSFYLCYAHITGNLFSMWQPQRILPSRELPHYVSLGQPKVRVCRGT